MWISVKWRVKLVEAGFLQKIKLSKFFSGMDRLADYYTAEHCMLQLPLNKNVLLFGASLHSIALAINFTCTVTVHLPVLHKTAQPGKLPEMHPAFSMR
ncbi:hypothetical protein ASG33_05470 [Dyadobacter sp. Leaf189]|nr:hypothetical protein ASG33_05470 [Dyadobacter sp. Leaf189]